MGRNTSSEPISRSQMVINFICITLKASLPKQNFLHLNSRKIWHESQEMFQLQWYQQHRPVGRWQWVSFLTQDDDAYLHSWLIHDFYRCPDPNILSPFSYNPLRGTAEATLYSMFKFPESKRAHFQCDIVICRGMLFIEGVAICLQFQKCPSSGAFSITFSLLGRCPDSQCGKSRNNGTDLLPLPLQPQARSLEPKADALLQPSDDGALMASYSVFVLEPGEKVGKYSIKKTCATCTSMKLWDRFLKAF